MTGHLVASLPAILGHEGSGIVAEVGPGVTSLKPGDHVIPIWRLSCGVCEYCSGAVLRSVLRDADSDDRAPSGRDDTLQARRKRDQTLGWGLELSEYSVIPAGAVLKIPDDFPLDMAALLGCGVITGVGAVFNAAQVKPGAAWPCLVPEGWGSTLFRELPLPGRKIIAVDLLSSKLEFARRFGATHTINAKETKPVEAIRVLTGGRGVDYAFEVIGLPETIRQAYDTLSKRGMAVAVGVAPMTTEVSVPVMTLVYEERILTGSVYGSSRPAIDIPKLINLYRAGKLKLDELLTRRYRSPRSTRPMPPWSAGRFCGASSRFDLQGGAGSKKRITFKRSVLVKP